MNQVRRADSVDIEIRGITTEQKDHQILKNEALDLVVLFE